MNQEHVLYEDFPHVLRSQQFSREALLGLFSLADSFQQPDRMRILDGEMRGINAAIVFHQQSLFTLESFRSALLRSGASVRDYPEARWSSVVSSSGFYDLLIFLETLGYNLFIVRWDREGSVQELADELRQRRNWKHPIINAGDGEGQHPTRGINEVYTLWNSGKVKNGMTVGVMGDLARDRIAHSFVYLMVQLGCVKKFYFVSPESCRMKAGILRHLREHEVEFEEHFDGALGEFVDELDVIRISYPDLSQPASDINRRQREHQFRSFVFDKALAERLPEHGAILHPLPRDFELPHELDDDDRALYHQSMRNFPWLITAILKLIHEHSLSR
ncbi:MAG: hypothetical protein Q8Q20_05030 [bacterium]|nr:hypothetical protein [bacterium]